MYTVIIAILPDIISSARPISPVVSLVYPLLELGIAAVLGE
jgi:hypothetical protein